LTASCAADRGRKGKQRTNSVDGYQQPKMAVSSG
jgi:hypothetical protein